MYRAPGEDGHSIITDAQERCVIAVHGNLITSMQTLLC